MQAEKGMAYGNTCFKKSLGNYCWHDLRMSQQCAMAAKKVSMI